MLAPVMLAPENFSEQAARVIDEVIGMGNLTNMSAETRVNYYRRVCESLGLNPLTKPFEYVSLQGQLRFYATKGCTDQLRGLHKVTVEVVSKGVNPQLGTYEVWARATRPDGRTDEDLGAVNVKGLQGEALANAMMKAITKAKRRVTLSICGLGWLDETEVETIPGAVPAGIDVATGEVMPGHKNYSAPEKFAPQDEFTPQNVPPLNQFPSERRAGQPAEQVPPFEDDEPDYFAADDPELNLGVTRDGTPRAERTPAQERAVPQERTPAQSPNIPPPCTSCNKALTRAQSELSVRNFGQSLCPKCQTSTRRPELAAA